MKIMSNQTWTFPVRKSRKAKSKQVEVTIYPELNAATEQFVGLAEATREYLKLKAQLIEIEARMKEVRAPIEEAIVIAGHPIEVNHIVWHLQPCERETFRLKEARNHLKPELLAPFVTVSRYQQLVSRGKK